MNSVATFYSIIITKSPLKRTILRLWEELGRHEDVPHLVPSRKVLCQQQNRTERHSMSLLLRLPFGDTHEWDFSREGLAVSSQKQDVRTVRTYSTVQHSSARGVPSVFDRV
jgi:hypothetical protein